MSEELNLLSAAESRKRSSGIKTLRNGLNRSLLLIVAIFFVFLGVYFYNLLFPAPVPLNQNEINESIHQALASATPQAPYASVVYQIILPSLVYIQTQGENTEDKGEFSAGSGAIINEDGDILTALHVVMDAAKIEVFFADGSQSTAEIILEESENDIAVLHPHQPPELIVPAVIGNSRAMRVGDEAYAVGNPMGLLASLSAGVISGFDRSIPIGNEGDQQLDGVIQFDTAVNPGNSGGPLLNRQGQIVGIVIALANPSGQNFFAGIGFAVPIGTAMTIVGGPEY